MGLEGERMSKPTFANAAEALTLPPVSTVVTNPGLFGTSRVDAVDARVDKLRHHLDNHKNAIAEMAAAGSALELEVATLRAAIKAAGIPIASLPCAACGASHPTEKPARPASGLSRR